MPAWLPKAILIFQDILSILIVVLILLQSKGSGVSGIFGGGEGNVYRTRRGAERIIYIATIVLIIFWFAAAIANLLIRR